MLYMARGKNVPRVRGCYKTLSCWLMLQPQECCRGASGDDLQACRNIFFSCLSCPWTFNRASGIFKCSFCNFPFYYITLTCCLGLKWCNGSWGKWGLVKFHTQHIINCTKSTIKGWNWELYDGKWHNYFNSCFQTMWVEPNKFFFYSVWTVWRWTKRLFLSNLVGHQVER